jgi:predicted RNA-binding protein with PUA-like domain
MFWLMKSEPAECSIDDLARAPQATLPWVGVRNFQARNMMRDQMKRGDLAFFYHSNCAEPGIVGIVEIVREAYPDATAGNPTSEYFDPKHSADNPRWYVVEVQLQRRLKHTITLAAMKDDPALAEMPLVRRGNRLSVMPVTAAEWQHILSLE